MLREAELFAMSEPMLVEVLGRIRPADQGIVVPPLFDLPGLGQPTPMSAIIAAHAFDDACVPVILAGGSAADVDDDPGTLLGADPQASIARLAHSACAATARVDDGEVVVRARYGDLSARDYLLRLTVTRSLVAHYVAAFLGSTACPLPEELARPLWELTAPDAAAWRGRGVFHDPLPVPHLASWRDTFLLMAGHRPHPLGH